VVQISTYQKSNSTKCDLLYSILLALGGTMNDVKQLYNNSENDLLFAVLTALSGGLKITIQPSLYHNFNGTEGNNFSFAELANIPRSQIIAITRSGNNLHVITAGNPFDLDALYTADANGGNITVDTNAPFGVGETLTIVYFK